MSDTLTGFEFFVGEVERTNGGANRSANDLAKAALGEHLYAHWPEIKRAIETAEQVERIGAILKRHEMTAIRTEVDRDAGQVRITVDSQYRIEALPDCAVGDVYIKPLGGGWYFVGPGDTRPRAALDAAGEKR